MAFVCSTAKYLYLKIYPALNIFLGTEDAAVNKIDGKPCSWEFMLCWGRQAVNNKISKTYAMSDGDKCYGNKISSGG